MKINIRKAREKFSEIVNTVAIKGERVILLSNKKPKAAIVSLKDLEVLERRGIKKRIRFAQIKKVRKMRNIIRKEGIISNSNTALQRIREDRIEKLSGVD